MPSFKKGIPVPEKRIGHRFSRYQWMHAWEIGDCVDVDTRQEANKICSVQYQQKPWGSDGKLVTRKVQQNDNEVIRIWRVA